MAMSNNMNQRERDKFVETGGDTAVRVVVASGGGSGTEYTEGGTDASITGTAIMWEDTSDTLRAVSAAKPLPVVQSVAGYIATASHTITRPADATAYAAKDAVSNSTSSPSVMTFSSMARSSGGSGYITKARLMTDQSTNTARFRLHLFHTSPTAINDNAAHTLLWANRANRIGFIDFDACSTEGSGSDAANSFKKDFAIPFTTSGSANLFGLLETLDAFTPASAQNIYVELTADQN